jgi:hypothetical protein
MYKMLLGSKVNYRINELFSLITCYDGCDNRFNLTSDIDYEKLRLINISFVNFKLLKKLEDTTTPTCEKLVLIENSNIFNYSIKPNIAGGDLYKDWDFTF